jgi:3-isopropylmalate/(R)-2-methylmalate dehydratase large subunit
MAAPPTLFDKIWSSHAILVRLDGATLLHIDRHLVHDGSGNAAFGVLKEKGLARSANMNLQARNGSCTRASTAF